MPAAPGPPPVAPPEAGRAAVMRGVALTVPAALLGVAAAVRVDAWLDLPGWGRGLLALGWLLVAAAAGWGWTAIPVRSGGRLGPAAAGLLAALSLAVIPAVGDRVRRLFLPFYTPLPDRPYRVTASSGDPAVARGGSVTLTAVAEPSTPHRPPPETATLIVRDRPGGPALRLPMAGDGRGVFSATRAAVADGFDYAVEVGPTRTGWHAVTAIDAVGLADGSAVRVEPPDYARSSRPPRTFDGFVGFDGPQFGRVEFDLHFTRPAVDIALTWRPDAGGPTTVPFAPSPDRTSLRAVLFMSKSGILTLTLAAERDVRTTLSVPVRVVPDAPPRFETATGLGAGPWEAAPDAVLRGDLGVRDDFGITSMWVESEINDAPPTVEPLRLARLGPGWAAGSFALPLAGRVKNGDTVRVRVRASDNRSVAAAGLGPQAATYPPDGWAVFRVVRSPYRPPVEQAVFADRDRTKARLNAALTACTQAGRRVADVARELTRSPPAAGFAVDQTVRLTEARDDIDAVAAGLTTYADELAVVPDLRPGAAAVRSLVSGPVRSAVDHLRVALATGHAPPIEAAAGQLRAATDGLTALVSGADPFAQDRLDRHALRAVVADLRSNQPADSARRLAAIVSASPSLSAAAEQLDREAVRELIARTKRLADDHGRLTAAVAETARQIRDQALADLGVRQTALTREATAFAERTRAASRIVGTGPMVATPGSRAIAALRDGRTTDAAAEAVKVAQEFDRLADAFGTAVDDRADAKAAAKQLAHWQADLRQRVADAGRTAADARRRFAAEQRSIHDSLLRLHVPNGFPSLDAAKTSAVAASAAACDSHETAALAAAAEATSALADRVPARGVRLKASQTVVERLIRDQDAIGQSPAADAAARQDDMTANLDALDVLDFGHRRTAAADASRRAAIDLRTGLPLDVPASQAHARRQLVRLRVALSGGVPDDERAAELARQQQDIADAAEKLPPGPTAEVSRPLADRQKELAHAFNALTAPDATSLLVAARNAADRTARRTDAGEFRKLARAAAGATARLAARLTGAESDLDQVRTIASQFGPHAADEFALVRVGAAQAEKKQAADALAKCRSAADADRPALQQAAAKALTLLAEAMARNGDRSAAHPLPQKPPVVDVVSSGCPTGPPTRVDADAARELARHQRTVLDEITRTAADLARCTAAVRGPLAERVAGLRKELDELARRTVALADDFAHTDDQTTGDTIRRAAHAHAEAVRESDAGRPANAADAHRRAADALAEVVAEASHAAPPPTPTDPVALSAVAAVRRAEGLLTKADPTAVDAIDKAIRALESR